MSDRFFGSDIVITDDGNLAVDVNLDVATCFGIDYVVQSAKNRIRSVSSDWYHDNIGANLEVFIGQPNTQETATQIENAITVALTADSFCNNDEVAVFASPINSVTVLIGVFIDTEFQKDPISFTVELNFLTGFKIYRTT